MTSSTQPTNSQAANNQTLSPELIASIEYFAREQSRHHIDRNQMTYWEKLQDKVDRTSNKLSSKINRFKRQSAQRTESQADLKAYMTDYVSDLIAQGLTPADALAKASAELAYENDDPGSDELAEHYALYFGTAAYPAHAQMQVAIGAGLTYGGCTIIGAVTGTIAGAIIGLKYPNLFASFSSANGSFLISLAAGLLCGATLGVGVAMLLHARTLRRM